MKDSTRLLRYILAQKKKILFGIFATIGMAVAETLTGGLFKILTDSLTKLYKKAPHFSEETIKIPFKITIPIPMVKEKITLFETRVTGYESIIKMIIILCLVFLLFSFFYSLSRYLREIYMNYAMQKILQKFKEDIYAVIVRLPKKFFDTHQTGDTISRVTFDVAMLLEVLNILIEISRAGIYCLIILPILFYINWKITLCAIIFFPLSFFIINYFRKKIKIVSKKITDNVGDYTAFLEEKINGFMLLKSCNTEDTELEEFKNLVDYNFRKNYKNITLLHILKPSNEFLASAGMAIMIFYLGYSLVKGQSTLGNSIFFLFLVKTLYKPIKKVAMAMGQLQVALVSTGKIFRLLNEDREQELILPNRSSELSGMGSIECKDLVFSYNEQELPVLNNISMNAEKGSLVVIAGESGSGKSTLLHLIPRYYNSTAGAVLVNGIPTGAIPLSLLRGKIAFVHQKKFFFSGSIDYNASYALDSMPSSEELPLPIRSWHNEFLNNKDVLIGAGGRELSAGEKQRLSIVRAFLQKREVLIMDEPSANLDEKSKQDLYRLLELPFPDRVVIVATHDREIIDMADVVYTLKNGSATVQRNRL
ncbi:MAG: ABC transporter ATP-binding protein [bacterium]|nr:ABC transporter ATP-binding protein [bacterium]